MMWYRVVIAGFLVTAAAGFAGPSPPLLEAVLTDTPPAIDGRPSDACWENLPVATDFSVLASAGSERAFRQTSVRAVWDQRALYLLTVCVEPQPETLSAKATERDGPTWLDDAVEIFLRPDAAAGEVYHFVINSNGVLFDQKEEVPAFDITTEPAVRIGEQSWVVELAIPWADLGIAAPLTGDEWGFNVGREHRPHEPTEWSTWAPLKEGLKKFSVPAEFGRLRFVDAATPARVSSLALPEGLIRNAWFADGEDEKAEHWHVREGSRRFELVPMSEQFAVGGTSAYTIVSQQLGIPVKAGDIYTVFAILRGTPEATGGIAVIQQMDDGRPDDLYPFWNLSLSPHWQLYSGRIVVDEGAEHFKAAALYRSNRKGRVDCAYMQILPGIHGVEGIIDIASCTRPGERATGPIWETPSLRPFNPLPDGPLKTAVFISKYQRDAAELMQRLDLDADVIYCPSFRGTGTVETVVAYDARRVLRDLAARRYDLIILAGRPSEQAVVDGIIQSVQAGTGLLVIDPVSAEKPANAESYATLNALLPEDPLSRKQETEIFGGLNRAVLDGQSHGGPIVKRIAARELQRGRVVRISWADKIPGLIPFREGSGSYWEYRLAALAKAALWATHRQPRPHLGEVRVEGDMIAVSIVSAYVPGMRLALTWDTPDGEHPATPVPIPPYTSARTRLGLDIPAFIRRQRGPTVARIQLETGEGPRDLGAALLAASEPRITLADLQVPDQAAPGSTVSGKVTCSVMDTAEAAVSVELSDAFGRVVDRVHVPAPAAGRTGLPFSLRLRDPLSVYHRVVVIARDGPMAVAARLEAALFVPDVSKTHLTDFQLGAGYAVMQITCQPYLLGEFVGYLRHHGVTACTVNESLIMHGMPAWGGTVCGTGMAQRDRNAVRTHCFSDPDKLRALAEGTVEKVAKRHRWGFFGYNMHDEVHLSQKADVETCASKHCIAQFQVWARNTYGDIETANREWGTQHKTFDELTMPRIADMKGERNPARWVDYRLFMEQVWAQTYATSVKQVHERFPEARLSFTNPYKYNSLSGTDFSLWTPNEQVLLRYFHRHVMDRNRSWSRAPMLAWIGYRDSPERLRRFMWWFALNGGTTPIWWDPILPWAYSGKPGYTPWYMFDPLWRETVRGKEVTAAALDLQAGIGKLLGLAEPTPAEALILHSQPSMHVLYAEAAIQAGRVVDTGYNAYRASDDAMAAALGRSGLTYSYAVSGRLTAAVLADVDLVVLPSCVSLQAADIAALGDFAARGGRLLADRQPGTHSAHGRPLGEPALNPDLFDGTRGICLGHGATKEDAATVDDALAALDIRPSWTVTASDGGRAGPVQVIRLRLADTDLIGIVQDAGDAIVEDLVLTLPGRKALVDLRQRTALGHRDAVRLRLARGETALFAAMDRLPRGIDLRAGVIDRDLVVTAAVKRRPALMHVFHVTVTEPGQSTPTFCYTRNIAAAGGKAVVSIPLALDDPAGLWTVRVRDILTGHQRSSVVAVPVRE